MNILFSAKVSKRHQERLLEKFPSYTFNFCKGMDEAEQLLPTAKVLVTFGEDLNSVLVEKAVDLEWIMVLSAGMDQMPFKVIHEKGILVTNARGIHKVPMAEYVISMLLQVYRQEKVQIQNEQNKVWDKSVQIQEVTGKTMLVVGAGSIGEEIARLGKAFQMKTYGISKSGKSVRNFDENYSIGELENILPKADFIVSVLPSTLETVGLFKMDHFKLMLNTAIFINIGRGDVVQSDDLLLAVQQKEIAHAVIDVFEEEPLPVDHPFWIEENITITSHLSGVSSNYITRALEIFDKNLPVFADDGNNYLNEIDLTKGY